MNRHWFSLPATLLAVACSSPGTQEYHGKNHLTPPADNDQEYYHYPASDLTYPRKTQGEVAEQQQEEFLLLLNGEE